MLKEIDDDITRWAIHVVMFNEGIVPMERPLNSVDRALKSIDDPKEKRKFKRKFRKLWRKLDKKYKLRLAERIVCNPFYRQPQSMILAPEEEKGKRPSQFTFRRRRFAVYDELMNTMVRPLVRLVLHQKNGGS